jgi:hypothetical protein
VEENVYFHDILGADPRQAVANLIAEGDRIQFSDKAYRRELADWLRPNRSQSRDGIPGYALGMGSLQSYFAPFVMRVLDVGRGQAAKDRQRVLGAGHLAILGTPHDDPVAWLATGQALAKVFLRAVAGGVSMSLLNAPIEVRALRPRLRDLLGQEGHPQLLLRLGYGPDVRATPRRSVSEVLRA